jgi:RNA polymerase sigma factor (sigma-70 family)
MTGDDTINQDNIAAAAKIFEEHGDFIYNIIRYKTTDQTLVDDIFQDFFLSLAANPVSLQGNELKAFLYRAIINDIHDAARRVKNYRNLIGKYVENRQFLFNISSLKNAIPDEEEIVKAVMKHAWNELSPKEINAISLRYLEGCSITEIAKLMRLKPASVSRYISIGLKKLRECLSKSSEEAE